MRKFFRKLVGKDETLAQQDAATAAASDSSQTKNYEPCTANHLLLSNLYKVVMAASNLKPGSTLIDEKRMDSKPASRSSIHMFQRDMQKQDL